MDKEILGQRLRQAREQAHMSQLAAAKALRIPRTAIPQIERGKRSVSTLELTKLAQLYHRPILHFLEEEQEDVLVTLHRAERGFVGKPGVEHYLNLCVDLCREGISLEKLLGRSDRTGLPHYSQPISYGTSEAIAQGEYVAEQERRRLGLGSAPIADIVDLMAGQGMWVASMDLPDKMSGLFLHHPNVGMLVLVHAHHTKARKRFSYAHEYAHALLDRHNSISVTKSHSASEPVEKRANAFAAAFLMPEEGVRDFLRHLHKADRGEKAAFEAVTREKIHTKSHPSHESQQITCQDVSMLAYHFGVSYQAATYRLLSLRRISPKACNRLLAQGEAGKTYLRVLDMLDDLEGLEDKRNWSRELRGQVVHLALEAYRREKISLGKLIELSKMVEISPDTMLELAQDTYAN